MANSRPSSPEPSNIKVARYMARRDSGAAVAGLERQQRGNSMFPLLFVAQAAAHLATGAAPPSKLRTPNDIIAAAPQSAWKAIPADDRLVIDLGTGGRVIVQLAPAFAPIHVANIKALARAGYWKDASVYRLQDNYVAQWGLNDSGKPWPAGVNAKPPAEYVRPLKGIKITPLGSPDPYAPGVGFA